MWRSKAETVVWLNVAVIYTEFPAVTEQAETDASVHESASHTSSMLGYSSHPISTFDYSAPVSDEPYRFSCTSLDSLWFLWFV